MASRETSPQTLSLSGTTTAISPSFMLASPPNVPDIQPLPPSLMEYLSTHVPHTMDTSMTPGETELGANRNHVVMPDNWDDERRENALTCSSLETSLFLETARPLPPLALDALSRQLAKESDTKYAKFDGSLSMSMEVVEAKRRPKERKNILMLPAEVFRIIFDRYLAIVLLNPLRLVCKDFDSLLRVNCALWHRRLPIMFETEDCRVPIRLCRVHLAVTSVQVGAAPLASLANVFCFGGCCYSAWSRNMLLLSGRRKQERAREERLNYAAAVFQTIFFPAEGSAKLSTGLVCLALVCLMAFIGLLYSDGTGKLEAFLPLWGFFFVVYTALHQFFMCSTIEPIVLAIVCTVGFNLTAILSFFYRVDADGMSWVGCLTPSMLCIACGATYASQQCHKFLQHNHTVKSVIASAVSMTIMPVMLLVFLLMFGSELDGKLIVPHARVSGIPLVLMFGIVLTNIIYALRVVGVSEMFSDEPFATLAISGYACTCLVGVTMGVLLLADVNTDGLFSCLLIGVSLFFFSTIINAAINKDQMTQFKYLLFPVSSAA